MEINEIQLLLTWNPPLQPSPTNAPWACRSPLNPTLTKKISCIAKGRGNSHYMLGPSRIPVTTIFSGGSTPISFIFHRYTGRWSIPNCMSNTWVKSDTHANSTPPPPPPPPPPTTTTTTNNNNNNHNHDNNNNNNNNNNSEHWHHVQWISDEFNSFGQITCSNTDVLQIPQAFKNKVEIFEIIIEVGWDRNFAAVAPLWNL